MVLQAIHVTYAESLLNGKLVGKGIEPNTTDLLRWMRKPRPQMVLQGSGVTASGPPYHGPYSLVLDNIFKAPGWQPLSVIYDL